MQLKSSLFSNLIAAALNCDVGFVTPGGNWEIANMAMQPPERTRRGVMYAANADNLGKNGAVCIRTQLMGHAATHLLISCTFGNRLIC